MSRTWMAVLVVAVLPAALARADDKGLLEDVKARRKIEAQRVEREFTENRAAAYKLVRSDDPKVAEATEKLLDLKKMVEKDDSLDRETREKFLVTVKYDLDRVKEIAAERRKSSRNDYVPPSVVKRETPRYSEPERQPTKDAKRVIEDRKGFLDDRAKDRETKNKALTKVRNETYKSAVAATEADRFPRDWAEKSRRTGSGTRMTAKEKAIMNALNKTVEVDFSEATFSEVIDWLKTKTGIDVAADKRGLEEASVGYETKINLKMKGSTRNVIRKLLANLGLAYYIGEETLQITSLERAKQQTTIRTYYVGDLALVTDTRLPYDLSRLQALQTINTIIELITGIEPQSWKSEQNPDAPGTVVFDPVRMTLIVRQSAEFHFRMSGK